MTFSESNILESFKNDESIKKWAQEVSDEIVSGKYDITSFVDSLGFALTSPSVEMRANGTKLLSTTLSNLPVDQLNETQLEFIVTFYCDRLKDHHSVLPAVLDGISALILMKHYPQGSSSKILTTFFQHITCQSQVRGDREKIYHIIKNMCENQYEELKKMGPDFVYGVINSTDGERDPRNLSFLFKFMPDFIKRFPPGHLCEDLFDTFACYFPIDFHPTKNDPASISREYLADNLANCLVSTEEFIESTIALLLEKLESDLIVAKLDSLELLSRCSKNFNPEIIEPHFMKIWALLKTEILPGTDNKDIVTAALLSLKNLLECFSKKKDISKNVQTTIMCDILNYLIDTEHRLFAPSTSVALLCVNCDPSFAAEKILSSFLLKIQSEKCSFEELFQILTFVADTLKICLLKSFINEIPADTIIGLQNELIRILSDDAADNELKTISIKCIGFATTAISEANRNYIYNFISTILTSEVVQMDLREVIQAFATHFPEEIRNNFLRSLLENFHTYNSNLQSQIFSNLTVLISIPTFEADILNFINTNIFNPKRIDTQNVALNSLELFLKEQATDDIIQMLYLQYNVVDNMFNMVQDDNRPHDTLRKISTILSLIIRKLHLEQQSDIIEKYVPTIKTNSVSSLYLLEGIIGFMHESINFEKYFQHLLEELINMALNADDEVSSQLCNHLICSLVNKVDHTITNKNIVDKCLNNLNIEIGKGNKKTVEICCWIAKGMVIKGDKTGVKLVELIVTLLDDNVLCSSATLGFDIIAKDVPEIHLPVTTLLYKQKIFHIILNKLSDKLKMYSEIHINAFMYILQVTPNSVVKMNIEEVGPVLFKCLVRNNSASIKTSLNVIKHFLGQCDEYFRSHLAHLISELISLTQYNNSMKIRILALECLEAICNYPTYIIQPHKIDVVFGLVPALDDRKRLVRNAAVKARNAWFVLESVGNGNAK